MLRAGADTSLNGRYISIVIGVPNDIKNMYARLGCDDIHMRKMCKREKQKIKSNFRVVGDVFVACLEVNKASSVNMVYDRIRGSKHKRFVENQYDTLFRDKLKQICHNFISNHNSNFDGLVFEIDKDLRKAFNHLKIQNKDPDIVHEIADIVANSNASKRNLKNVVEENISKDLKRN